jgi:hypothetical protein
LFLFAVATQIGLYFFFTRGAREPAMKHVTVEDSRLLGIPVGCLVGCLPLFFLSTSPLGNILCLVASSAVFTVFPKSDRSVLRTAALFVPLLLYLASSASVSGPHAVPCPWFPASLGIFVALVIIVSARVLQLSWQKTTLFFIVPGLIFILNSSLYHSVIGWDFFHEGEVLTTAHLWLKGYFPYRDMVFVHGLWMNPLQGLAAFSVFGEQRWSLAALNHAILTPVFFVTLYISFLSLFGEAPIFAVAAGLFSPYFLNGYMSAVDQRFIFAPVIGVFTLLALRKRKTVLTGILGCLLCTQFIAIPETAFFLVGACSAVLLYEWQERGAFPWKALSALAVGGLLTFGVWLGFLASHNAVGSYFEYFHNFASDHRYGSGIEPVSIKGVHDIFLAVAPLLCIVYFLWRLSYQFFRGQVLSPRDCLILAWVIFTILYFTKFLSRMDPGHAARIFMPALPLFFLMCLEVFRRVFSRHAALVLSLVLFFGSARGLADAVTHIPEKWRAPGELTLAPRVGPSVDVEKVNKLYTDFTAFFADALEPGQTVYDFTNLTSVFYFLFDLEPVSRYHIINYAMHDFTQDIVIHDLEKKRPPLAIFHDTWNMTHSMDSVENMVRHWKVSRFLLRQYKPLGWLDGYLILSAKNQASPPNERTLNQDRLYDIDAVCDWGFAPRFGLPKYEATASTLATTVARNLAGDPAQFELSSSSDFRQWDWLSLTVTSMNDGVWDLAFAKDPKPGQIIRFRVGRAPEATTVHLAVSSCLFWHDPQWGRTLYLRAPADAQVLGAQLTGIRP